MDDVWSFYQDKKHQVWLWRAIDHETGEAIAYWFGTREHKHLDKLLELLEPFSMAKVYAGGNYVSYERFDSDTLMVSKKNTQKIECKYWSLRTWCSRLVRKGIRFSKSLLMHKIAIGLAFNVHFFGNSTLLQ